MASLSGHPPIIARVARRAVGTRTTLEWEYIGGSWPSPRMYRGWNVQSVVERQRSGWADVAQSRLGTGPLADGDLVRTQHVDELGLCLGPGRRWDKKGSLFWTGAGALGSTGCLHAPFTRERRSTTSVATSLYWQTLVDDCLAMRPFMTTTKMRCRRTYDFVTASSSLQYVRELARTAGRPRTRRPRACLLITRQPFVDEVRSFVVVQRPHLYGYDTEYPGWVLNKRRFPGRGHDVGMRQVREFVTGERPYVARAPEQPVYRGFLFERQSFVTSNLFQGRHALITGGLGFIGSHLARRLLDLGAEVTDRSIASSLNTGATSRMSGTSPIGSASTFLTFVTHTVCRRWSATRTTCSISLDRRAISTPWPIRRPISRSTATHNSRSSRRVAAITRRSESSTPSTRQVYGRPDYLPVDELHPLRPVDINGIHKVAGEWYHLLYNQVTASATAPCVSRTRTAPHMRVKDARQTFLGIWIAKAVQGETFEVWGGDQLRDFTFVDDAVDAFLLRRHRRVGNRKVFNLGGMEVVSLRDLADLLVSAGRAPGPS